VSFDELLLRLGRVVPELVSAVRARLSSGL
jgi:hypothetical protein